MVPSLLFQDTNMHTASSCMQRSLTPACSEGSQARERFPRSVCNSKRRRGGWCQVCLASARVSRKGLAGHGGQKRAMSGVEIVFALQLLLHSNRGCSLDYHSSEIRGEEAVVFGNEPDSYATTITDHRRAHLAATFTNTFKNHK